jgi:hypothetical protein
MTGGIVALALALKFAVPPGWVDLSPGAPEANWQGIPPQLRQMVQKGNAAFYAADVAGGSDGFMENVNVILKRSPGPITESTLDELSATMAKEMPREAPGMSYKLIDRRIVKIAGVDCGRVVGELDMKVATSKQLLYLIPGGEQLAIVTYSTTPTSFAIYEPIFDTAAQATQGVAATQSTLGRITRSAGRGALIGGIAGGLGALIVALFRRKKKPA